METPMKPVAKPTAPYPVPSETKPPPPVSPRQSPNPFQLPGCPILSPAAGGKGREALLRLTVQQLPQFAPRAPNAHIERPKQRIHRAHFIEPHFVDELFEHQRIIGKQIHAPLPIVKPNRPADNLPHLSRIAA